MLLVADVHGAADALEVVAKQGETLLVLGDFVNLIDHRTGDGIIADVIGRSVVMEISRLRAEGHGAEASALWLETTGERRREIDKEIKTRMEQQYREVCAALEFTDSYVLFGNVDRPDMLRSHLGRRSQFVDAETREIDGLLVGFVGGGLPRIGTEGEVAHDTMAEKLASLGRVDILCTHVPPDVPALARDVVGRTNKGSREILEYLIRFEPTHHYFGDIHQPMATRWQVGRTMCINVGYFRATGRALSHR